MSQDSDQVVLGAGGSNIKEVTCHNVDPANFAAGLACTLGSDGLPSLLKSAGGLRIGISMGKSLSDHKKTDIARSGFRIPVRAALNRSTGTVTITNVSNLLTGTADTVTIGGQAFTAQAGAATPTSPVFQASGTTAQTATSLATQINAHVATAAKVFAVANAAIVTLYAMVEGAGTGHDVTTTYEDLGTATVGATVEQAALAGGSNDPTDIAFAVIGQKMYINDISGKADVAMTGLSTISDATYVAGPKTGIAEDGTEVAAVLVDMQGGL